MTTNATTWNPPVGRLIVRITEHEGDHIDTHLAVAAEAADEHGITRYQCIAVQNGAMAEPRFCGYINMTATPEERTPLGLHVTQRLATDEDIAAVVCAWNGRYSLDAWIEDIDATGARIIAADELARLQRIVAEVGR